jgi:peptide deformylase
VAILEIRKFGDEVLRRRTEEVEVFDEGLQRLIDDMVDTMYAAPGVGLAANQIGVSKRVMVIDLSVGRSPDELHVFVNPEIVESEGSVTEEEGCLSIPDFVEIVTRPGRVKVRYKDQHGVEHEMWGEGLMSRALCHEIDHLNGMLFIDYLRGLKKERIVKKIQKLFRSGIW